MHQPEITGLSWRWRWHPLKTWKPDPCLVCLHRGVWAPGFLLCRAYRRLHPRCSDWSQAAGTILFSLFVQCHFFNSQVQRERILKTEEKFTKELSTFTDTARRVSFRIDCSSHDLPYFHFPPRWAWQVLALATMEPSEDDLLLLLFFESMTSPCPSPKLGPRGPRARWLLSCLKSGDIFKVSIFCSLSLSILLYDDLIYVPSNSSHCDLIPAKLNVFRSYKVV